MGTDGKLEEFNGQESVDRNTGVNRQRAHTDKKGPHAKEYHDKKPKSPASRDTVGLAVGVRSETELYFIKRAAFIFEKRSEKTTRYQLGGQVLDWFVFRMMHGPKKERVALRHEVERYARKIHLGTAKGA